MKFKRLAALVLAGALCMTSLAGCGVKADETAATLGDQTVSAGLVNFVCKYEKAAIDDVYVAYFGEDFWGQDLYGYGTTMEDDMKASIMDALHEFYTLKAHMADYNVELTAEETAAIEAAADAFLAANSAEALEEMTASKEVIVEMLTLYAIRVKMYDAIIVDVDREVSDAEANMRGITLVEIGITGKYNDKGTYEKYTDEQIKAIKATAEKIASEAVSVGLEKAAKNNSYTATETAYHIEDDSINETLLKALNALKVGETSTVIETTSALYIATIDEDVDKEATEENRESIIAERESKLYSEKVAEWQKNDGWEVNDSVVSKIEFHHLLTQESTEEVETTEK